MRVSRGGSYWQHSSELPPAVRINTSPDVEDSHYSTGCRAYLYIK